MNPHEHTHRNTPDGVTVGLIDHIITSCKLLKNRNLTTKPAPEAIQDLTEDPDLALVLSSKPNTKSPPDNLPCPLCGYPAKIDAEMKYAQM